ncbi:MAG: tetratricopeptide repeat protein [Burkholderiales bacterium]|nr:tetratricopeptide repeat protein [Burkholderiales bacterium]
MQAIHRTLTLAATAALLALGAALAQASDSPAEAPPARASADRLVQARTLIAARNWSGALDELRRVDDTGSADWNNLMGFTLRKGRSPDLAGSEKYYDAALRIDPHHRNTLEYSGELSLMKGDLPRAQARLATLQAVCGGPCEQATQLRAAIADYQAHGNKYVSPGW